jgi:2-keto-4-pentenoate hydratase
MQFPVVTELHPSVLAGLAAQRERRDALLVAGAARVGWKMGRGIAEIEAVMGEEPVTGYLTGATMFDSGAVHPAGDAAALRAEVELALVVGDPGTEPIAGIATALELVDVESGRGSIQEILANNVFHRGFAIGNVHESADPAGRTARLWTDDELRGASSVRSDHVDTLRAAERGLAAIGESLAPGDVILTGSAVHVPVAPGDHVRVEIDGLDRLEVVIGD